MNFIAAIGQGFERKFVSPNFFNPKKVQSYESTHKISLDEVVHEEVCIPTRDGEKLSGYYFPSGHSSDRTFIFFHGRTGNIDDYSPYAIHMQKEFEALDFPINALVLDYRGYGNSTGNPDRINISNDSMAAVDFLKSRCVDVEKMVLVGHSNGAAVALDLASNLLKKGERVNSIVLLAPYLSPKDATVSTKGTKGKFLQIFVSNKYLNPQKLIKEIGDIPLTVIHGIKDSYFPLMQGVQLFGIANGSSQFLTKNSDHMPLLDEIGPYELSQIAMYSLNANSKLFVNNDFQPA